MRGTQQSLYIILLQHDVNNANLDARVWAMITTMHTLMLVYQRWSSGRSHFVASITHSIAENSHTLRTSANYFTFCSVPLYSVLDLAGCAAFPKRHHHPALDYHNIYIYHIPNLHNSSGSQGGVRCSLTTACSSSSSVRYMIYGPANIFLWESSKHRAINREMTACYYISCCCLYKIEYEFAEH